MSTSRRSWSELTPRQRRLVVAGGGVELALTAYAARDLARRDPGSVRGSRVLWALALVVQPVGPIAYLLRGRR